MTSLNQEHKTWVLSRLAIEMDCMPEQYSRFVVETWVESAMRYFTNRNFRIADEKGGVYGYGRSIWAMIDTRSRQPQNIFDIHNGLIKEYIETEKENPMAKLSRVQMGDGAELVRSIETYYNDVDVNGHVNSVKYIEHVLDLFSVDWYRKHRIRRFDIAYVAESHYGDKLNFYREQTGDEEFCIRITKLSADDGNDVEVCRSKIKFIKD